MLLGIAGAFILFFFSCAGAREARAAIVLNEIFFDPVGSDTGGEWIELLNNGSESADIGGWQLYPDKSGYFFLPQGFVVAPGSFVLVRLRSTGSDSSREVFYSEADENMGNTAGSVALFLPGKRGAETIKSFVQWGREKQTWESAASEAGLWEKGTFVRVENRAEGSSVGSTGAGTGADAWNLFSSPTPGAENSLPPAVSTESSAQPPPAPQPPPPAESHVLLQEDAEPLSPPPPASGPAPSPVENPPPVSPPPPAPAPMPSALVLPAPAPVSSEAVPVLQIQDSKKQSETSLHIASNKSASEGVVQKGKERQEFREPSPDVSLHDDAGISAVAASEESRAVASSAASAWQPRPYVFFLGAVAVGIAAALGFLAMKFAFWNESES